MSDYVLELKGITKIFPGVKALNNVQFQLKKGEVHALMGENGAGKSTLMKCMFGIYHMDQGEVIYEGEKTGEVSKEEFNQNYILDLASGGKENGTD